MIGKIKKLILSATIIISYAVSLGMSLYLFYSGNNWGGLGAALLAFVFYWIVVLSKHLMERYGDNAIEAQVKEAEAKGRRIERGVKSYKGDYKLGNLRLWVYARLQEAERNRAQEAQFRSGDVTRHDGQIEAYKRTLLRIDALKEEAENE
jgi:hypothetical protein